MTSDRLVAGGWTRVVGFRFAPMSDACQLYSIVPFLGARGTHVVTVRMPLPRGPSFAEATRARSTIRPLGPALRSSQLRWAIADSAVVPPPPSSTTSSVLLDIGPEWQTPSLIPNPGPDHILAVRFGV